MNRFLWILLLAFALLAHPPAGHATPEHAMQTKQPCLTCHIDENGGRLNHVGKTYAAGGHRWPVASAEPFLKLGGDARALLGYAHLLAAFLWFGAILYVHLILRPAYAEKGLPRSEVMLGSVSMTVVGASGLLLTLSRIGDWRVLIEGKWGLLLSLKIAIYLVMVSSAFFVVRYLGPRMREGLAAAEHPANGVFDPVTLAAFDGLDGRPAFVAYKGKVYEMTDLQRWKGGTHFKHLSGQDLTAALARAPHGPEKLAGVPVQGTYNELAEHPKTRVQRTFHFIAYLNLSLVLLVLLVVAFWRWS